MKSTLFAANASLQSTARYMMNMDGMSGLKRKRATHKFYSVRSGHNPGIYNTWDECLRQVKGHKGASYKSFTSLSDAEKFLKGEAISNDERSRIKSARKFYAVRSGRIPGIYGDWESAKKQITGWPKPRHKCFATKSEAQQFLEGGDEPRRGTQDILSLQPGSSSQVTLREHFSKKTKANELAEDNSHGKGQGQHSQVSITGLLDQNTSTVLNDGFDASVVLDPDTGQIMQKSGLQAQATKLMASELKYDSVIRVHTDGSSLGNGRNNAVAGVGVYFGPGNPQNISEPLSGPRQTNQRAELTAILRALEALPKNRNVEIITDSRYAIRCVTEWCDNWRRNGWRNSAGKPVENRDLVELILRRVEQRKKTGASTKYIWIKGHANHEGNVQADKLAVEGARAATEVGNKS